MHVRSVTTLLVAAIAATAVSAMGQAPRGPASPEAGEWRHYHRDFASTRYSPLDVLTPANVSDLSVAWRWKSDNFSTPADYKNESTPLMVGGTLYFTAGVRRRVVAADAATGETLREIDLPGSVSSSPMTYMVDGRQFIALWTSDQRSGQPAELVVLSTPSPRGGRGRGRGAGGR